MEGETSLMTNDTQKVFNFIKTHPIGTHFNPVRSVTNNTTNFIVEIVFPDTKHKRLKISFDCSIDSLDWCDSFFNFLTLNYERMCGTDG